MRSTEAGRAAEIQHPMAFRLLTLSEELAPARSVDLITAAMSEAFPRAGGRASAVASTEAVFMAADMADVGNRMYRVRNCSKIY